jgi:hypothetical protein
MGKGQGIRLGDYKYFCDCLDNVRGDSDIVKALHMLFYGSPGIYLLNNHLSIYQLIIYLSINSSYIKIYLQKPIIIIIYIYNIYKLGKKQDSKKNLRNFNGFPDVNNKEKKLKKLKEKKSKWVSSLLKDALNLFGLPVGGTRDELVGRLIDFLFNPSIIKKEGEKKEKITKELSSKKRKSSSSSR